MKDISQWKQNKAAGEAHHYSKKETIIIGKLSEEGEFCKLEDTGSAYKTKKVGKSA